MVAALVRVAVQLMLAIACALGVTSLIFAGWTVTQTGNQLPPVAIMLLFGTLALGWVSILSNTVITTREIPKDRRNPISMNVALYRRFARRSSRQVQAVLATVWVLGSALGATGIATSTPLRLMGGVLLAFYGFDIAGLIALLPHQSFGGDETPPT